MIIGVKLCFLFAAGIEPKGCRLTLKITDPEDLNRDVLKVQFYSLKTFCLGWLVLVFSRGDSIAHVHPTPLCTRKIQKTTQKTTFCKACEFSAKTTKLTQPRPQGLSFAVPFSSNSLYH